MKSFKRNILIIPLIFVLLSSSQAFGQPDLDSMKIIKLKWSFFRQGKYTHQGKFYKKFKDLAPVIYSAPQDAEAIRLFENYGHANTAGLILSTSSVVIGAIGFLTYFDCSFTFFEPEKDCSQTPLYVSAVLYGGAIAALFVRESSKKRSIERFNSLAGERSKLGFKLKPDLHNKSFQVMLTLRL